MGNKDLYNIKDVLDYQIHKVLKYSPLGYDELYQIAYLGYLKAQDNYNPDYGKMTLKYASIYIKQELWSALNKEYKYSSSHYSTEQDMEDVREEEVENPTANPLIKKVEENLHCLNDLERLVIQNYYLDIDNKTLIELAGELNLSVQRVHAIKDRALEKIRETLHDTGN